MLSFSNSFEQERKSQIVKLHAVLGSYLMTTILSNFNTTIWTLSLASKIQNHSIKYDNVYYRLNQLNLLYFQPSSCNLFAMQLCILHILRNFNSHFRTISRIIASENSRYELIGLIFKIKVRYDQLIINMTITFQILDGIVLTMFCRQASSTLNLNGWHSVIIFYLI